MCRTLWVESVSKFRIIVGPHTKKFWISNEKKRCQFSEEFHLLSVSRHFLSYFIFCFVKQFQLSCFLSLLLSYFSIRNLISYWACLIYMVALVGLLVLSASQCLNSGHAELLFFERNKHIGICARRARVCETLFSCCLCCFYYVQLARAYFRNCFFN